MNVAELAAGTARRPGILARIGLPQGSVPVGAGLAVLAISAYGFLAIAGNALGPVRYAQLSVLWSAAFLLGTGLFFSLEQEVGRVASARSARGEPVGAVVARGAKISGVATAALGAGIWIWRRAIAERFFDGDMSFVFMLIVALASFAVAYVARGFLAGTGRFGPYGMLNGAEGLLRVAPAAVLAAGAVSGGWGYAAAFAAAPALAAAVTVARPLRGLERGPACRPGELDLGLGRLVVATLLSQALLNLPVLAVKVLATNSEAALAGTFMAGVVMARVPVLAFSAVQAALVPRLSSLHALSETAEFRRLLARLGASVAAAGAAATFAASVAGAPAVELLFGNSFRLSSADLTLLAAGSAVYLVALALGQGLVARGSYARLAAGWAAGVAAGVLVTAAGGPLLARVERGFLAGSAVAAAVIAVAVFSDRRSGDRRTTSPAEPRVHEPV